MTRKVSISDLMANYRNSLSSIMPILEASGIAVLSPDAYDEWDSISQTLFDVIIKSNVEHHLIRNLNMSKLDLHYNSYFNLDYISVKMQDNQRENLAFVSFANDDYDLNYVYIAELDEKFNNIKTIKVIFEQLQFEVVFWTTEDNQAKCKEVFI